MGRKSKWEYLKAIYQRYHQAERAPRQQILDEFCQVCGYHRKYAIRLLNGPPPQKPRQKQRRRICTYGPQVIGILSQIWEAASYPWSVRLKALLPLWMPWAKKHFPMTPKIEAQLGLISPRTIDLRLKQKKRQLQKNLYGRTKPGSLLKHHIPIKTDCWDVNTPGFTEVDLVSHSGDCASGEFLHSLNMTDIHTTWVETRAVMGKGEKRVADAIERMRSALPFALRGIDSDNGSEFINHHLYRYCQDRKIQFTRGRPYKKDDNAHIEQKNWTHVRKLMGYIRYDSEEVLEAMNDLYQNELRLFQNLFQPSVKLVKKVRVGSRVKRLYDAPQTPFQRVCESAQADLSKIAHFKKLLESLDPFLLSQTIKQKLEHIYKMAPQQRSPVVSSTENKESNNERANIKTSKTKHLKEP
jgi:hypothetical protein